MWTRKTYEVSIPGLNVFVVCEDGVAKHYAVFPAAGHLIRVPLLDTEIESETGEKQIARYVSHGGLAERLSYDWQKNPKGYCAVSETEVEMC